MCPQRPDVSDEDIGMRAFQIRKAKAVERAADYMRQGLKGQWSSLTSHEIEELEWTLGELWAYVARAEWDDLRFGRLSLADLREVIGLGRELRAHRRDAVTVLGEIGAIVKSRG